MLAIVNVSFDTNRSIGTASIETMVATGVAYLTGGKGQPGNASATFVKLSTGSLTKVDINAPPGAGISSVLPRVAPGPARGKSGSASAVLHLSATPWFAVARGTSGTSSAILRIAAMVNYRFSATTGTAISIGPGIAPVIP
ncbi:hypothetical protein [Bradyrhizobium sp.]